MDTELNNYKKTIAQEQLHNEQLTLLLNKVQADINHVQHLIDQCSAKRDALKADYMTYTRTLQETEQALAKVETVSNKGGMVQSLQQKHCISTHYYAGTAVVAQ